VTHALSAAVTGMDQLLRQLDQRLTAHHAAGRLHDDGSGDPGGRVERWRLAVESAGSYLAAAARSLQDAAGQTSHLGLRDEETQP
jgi:hypothetical protein